MQTSTRYHDSVVDKLRETCKELQEALELDELANHLESNELPHMKPKKFCDYPVWLCHHKHYISVTYATDNLEELVANLDARDDLEPMYYVETTDKCRTVVTQLWLDEYNYNVDRKQLALPYKVRLKGFDGSAYLIFYTKVLDYVVEFSVELTGRYDYRVVGKHRVDYGDTYVVGTETHYPRDIFNRNLTYTHTDSCAGDAVLFRVPDKGSDTNVI